jgi:hypothetical protein
MDKKNNLHVESLSVDERVEIGKRLFENLTLAQKRQLFVQIIRSIKLEYVFGNETAWKEVNTIAAKDSFKTAFSTFLRAMLLIYGSKSKHCGGVDYFGGETYCVRRSPAKSQINLEGIISEEFKGKEEIAHKMMPKARAEFEDNFDSMIWHALIAASHEAMSPIYEATNTRFVKEYAGEIWHSGEDGKIVKEIKRIRQTLEDGYFTTKRVKQFKPGRLPLTEEQKEIKAKEKRAKFIAALNEAIQKWYLQGHRRKPRQADLAVIMYPPPNYRRESAESLFSRQLKNSGMKYADLELNRKIK